jgi:DNA segregation ATPase FtsK/SpoIIIE-like protein
MIDCITRRDICKELGINDYVLREYESFLELPDPEGDSYDLNTAKLIVKLHELVQSGYNYADIKYLSLCAERFSDLVPALNNFKELSPQHHLKQLVNYYNGLIGELAEREVHYQEKIRELEEFAGGAQSELERTALMQEHIVMLQGEKEVLINEIELRDKEIESLQIRIHEQDVALQEAEFSLNQFKDEIEKLRAELDYYSNQNQDSGLPKRSAVDIQALLKKKEKEVSLKYQREIFDLKKQVDMMVEQKEEEWLRNRIG